MDVRSVLAISTFLSHFQADDRGGADRFGGHAFKGHRTPYPYTRELVGFRAANREVNLPAQPQTVTKPMTLW